MAQHIEHLAGAHDLRLVSLAAGGSPDPESARRAAPEVVRTLSLVPHHPPSPAASWLGSRGSGWPATLWRYRSPALLSHLREEMRSWHPDVGCFENLHLAYLCREIPEIPWVAIQQNVETDFLRSVAAAHRPPLSWLYGAEARAMSVKEPELLSQAGAIVALQEEEADWIRRRVASVDTFVAPIAARMREETPVPVASRTGFLLVGTFEWLPNREAARWLLSQVWPRVRERMPAATLRILGRGAVAGVLAGEFPGVQWLGEVEDAGHYLSHSRALLVPLRSGAGLRVKILDALGSGIPVITTPEGLQGIPAVSGEQLLVAGGAGEFAERMIEVESDPMRAEAMARRGQEWIRAHYSWQAMREGIDAALRNAVGRRRAPAANTR